MFNTQRIRRDFSQAAPQYERHATLQQQVLARLLSRTAEMLSADALILDAGCGTGALARRLPQHKVIQLDIAHAMCEQAGSPAVNASAEALPFADGIFDVVYSSLMLQWTDHTIALKEMQRVVKPGGFLAFTTFAKGTLIELVQSFASADAYPHVLEFPTLLPFPLGEEDFISKPQASLGNPVRGSTLTRKPCATLPSPNPLPKGEGFSSMETITEHYPDALSLMRHLKSIGARNKLERQRKSLMTPRQMRKVEQYYRQHFYSAEGLRVTWNVLYAVVRKP